MTYHTAGELLQGGAAALFSICWLLFWEGEAGWVFGSGTGVDEGREGGVQLVSKKKKSRGGQALQKWGPGTMWELHFEWGQWQASRRSSVQMGEGRKAGINRGSCDMLESSILHRSSCMSCVLRLQTYRGYILWTVCWTPGLTAWLLVLFVCFRLMMSYVSRPFSWHFTLFSSLLAPALRTQLFCLFGAVWVASCCQMILKWQTF